MIIQKGEESMDIQNVSMTLETLADTGQWEKISAGQWTCQELDKRNSAGETPLMRAAIRGDYKVALSLKQAGATLDLKDAAGRKAVDLAALHGHSAVLASLIIGGCGG